MAKSRKSKGQRKVARDKALAANAKARGAVGKAGNSKEASAQRKALFVEAYLKNGENATEAAIAVGYSPKTAKQQGSRLLTNVAVKEAIATRRKESLAKAVEATDLTEQEVLADLRDGMRFNPKLLYRQDGSMREMHELPDEVAKQLEGVEYEEIVLGNKAVGRVAKIKFPKKTAVREQAMKHFGLFKEDNMQRQPSPLAALPIDLQQRLYDRLVALGYLGVGPDHPGAAAGGAGRNLPGVARVTTA